MTPDASKESGTSLYELNKEYKDIDTTEFLKDIDELKKLYKGEQYDVNKLDKDYEKLTKHFDKVIEVKNVYNRMISYDGGNWHSAGDFIDDERLTLVFFVNDIISSPTPYQRSNGYDLKIRSMI